MRTSRDYSDARHLTRLFTSPALTELAKFGKSKLLDYCLGLFKERLVNLSSLSMANIYNEFYGYLSQRYRYEYIYKNVIANKILLGRHSYNTATLISEFAVGTSKADVAIFNGDSTCYEIKTKFDSLDRLPLQIKDYKTIFNKIYVVTCEEHLRHVLDTVSEDIGIILLTRRCTLKNIRMPTSNIDDISTLEIFRCLRKSEYAEILLNYYGYQLDAPNTLQYKISEKLFTELDPFVAHNEMTKILQRRRYSLSIQEHVKSVPYSLKYIALTANFTVSLRDRLGKFLNRCLVFN